MKPRKPDRFERMVLKKTYPDMAVDKDDAIKLLRNEHAWMRRMVESLTRYDHAKDNHDDVCREWSMAQGRWLRRSEVLEQLDQRRK